MAKRKPPNRAEVAHIIAVKCMPCIVDHPEWFDKPGVFIPDGICRSEYDHITDSGSRLGHMYGLPLSINNHRGNAGYSGINRGAWDKSLTNQIALCRKVYKKLGKEMPEIKSKTGRNYG